jgi:hypothetical protein
MATSTDAADRAVGWVSFAAIMLFLAACFTGIAGLVALVNSRFYIAGAVYVFGDLRTWGWILVGLSLVELVAAGAVFAGREWSRWLGILVAALNAIGQMMFLSAYPWWSILIIGLNILVIYALAAYGTKIQAFE